MSDPIRINDYDLVQLQEYKGSYSLVLGYEKQDGSFAVKWSKQEFGKGNEKNVPVKVPLGKEANLVSAMALWLAEFGWKVVKADGEDDSTPF